MMSANWTKGHPSASNDDWLRWLDKATRDTTGRSVQSV